MSRRRVYSEQTLQAIDRYFIAFEECRRVGLIKSVSQFCIDCGIAPPHFYMQRKDRNRGFFEVGWITMLATRCNVSPNWVLCGSGEMFLV